MTSREPTLGDLLYSLWQARLLLLIGAATGLAAAFIFLSLAVPHYKAVMLVGAPERLNIRDGQAEVPPYSSVYQMAWPEPNHAAMVSDFVQFESVLRGATVAGFLLQDDVIRAGIARDRRFSFEGPLAGALESEATLAAYLDQYLKVEPVGLTSLRRLVYTHPEPEFAVYLLRQVHHAADQIIRDRVSLRTRQRVGWLNEMLARVQHPDHKKVLVGLLMAQEQARMLVALDEPFAASIIDPPVAGAKPYWPRRMIVFPIGLLVGLFLGYGVYGFVTVLRAARHQTPNTMEDRL